MLGRRAAVPVTITLAALALAAPGRGADVASSSGPAITATGSVTVGSAAVPGGNAATSPAFMAGRAATSVTVTDSEPVDGRYHPMGTLTVSFGGVLRDPRVHVYDLGDF